MPRALFVIDQLASGGAPRSVLKLTRALLASGMQVTLLSLSERLGLEVPEGAELHVVPFTPRGRLQKLRRYRLHAQRLDAFLEAQNERYDLVVSNLHQAHQVVRRSSLAGHAFLCIRSDPLQELLSNKQGWRRRIKARKVRWLYDRQRIIALSQTNLDSLETLGCRPRAAHVIPNVLELERIRERMQEPIAESDLAEAPFCLFVGRLVMRQKRLDRLLKAYHASGTSLPLVIIGDGDRASVEREIEALGLAERVTLLGKRANPFPYMRQARLLLLSSDYEGLPNVLLEALACGTPVVSTDCLSGPRDILQGDLRRGLVPLDDTDAFAAAIHDLLERPPVISEQTTATYAPLAVAAQYQALMEIPPTR